MSVTTDGKPLYCQALTGKTLYAIDTALLRERVSEQQRAAGVTTIAPTHVAEVCG